VQLGKAEGPQSQGCRFEPRHGHFGEQSIIRDHLRLARKIYIAKLQRRELNSGHGIAYFDKSGNRDLTETL
jgi:hypothetical protein